MRKENRSERGQTMIMMTLASSLVFGALALAVDVGWAYYRRETAQAAADSAALAAARAAMKSSPGNYQCGSNAVWCGSPAGTVTTCPSTVVQTPSSSFDNGCMMAAANGLAGQTVTLQANNTATVPTVSGPNTEYWVTARVYHKGNSLFGGIVPGTGGGLSVSVRSSAAIIASSGGSGCIYILDPKAPQAFIASNNAQLTLNCGLYVNSSANANSNQAAMYVTGSAFVQSTSINVVGSYFADNAGHASPLPNTGTTPVADPFANMPSPTPATPCASGNFTAWQPTQYTPAPGTYCGFTVGNGMNAQLSGGTYIINGGTFSIQGGSTLTATGGVLIYLTGGATVNIANGSTVTLSGQTSGSYQGVIFYQDRSMTTPGASTFAGGANMSFTGTLYFPHALVNINNGTNTTVMAIVADEVNFQGGAHFLADVNGAKTGIIPGVGVYLIE